MKTIRTERFGKTPSRKLSLNERRVIERYIATFLQDLPGEKENAPTVLTTHSELVYAVCSPLVRESKPGDMPSQWRYSLQGNEVHLPLLWDLYVQPGENHLEVICTQTVPIVIGINGHSILELDNPIAGSQPKEETTQPYPHAVDSAKGNLIELVNIRKETPEEHALHNMTGMLEAVSISLGLLIVFASYFLFDVINLWPITIGLILIIAGCWKLFSLPGSHALQEVHCLRGTPRHLGLFYANEPRVTEGNFAIGNIDLRYPSHWQNWVGRYLGKQTDIDIYSDRRVVRQGLFLSLHDEMKYFPVPRWGKNLILSLCAFALLLIMIVSLPLSMPLKLTLSWIRTPALQQITSLDEMKSSRLEIGDKLSIQGEGMCYVPKQPNPRKPQRFAPFDCSVVYWNTPDAIPVMIEPDIINKASLLLASVNQQLHPEKEDNAATVNPQLATAIQKSGMILINDLSEIVLKTDALCDNSRNCMRLKNALINLGNTSDWASLLQKMSAGRLEGMHVLLRPSSAEMLEKLVHTVTEEFINREIKNMTQLLSSTRAGGFLIASAEGYPLVTQQSAPAIDDSNDVMSRWYAFQARANKLTKTPFHATGVITGMTTDAQGTHHLTLHKELDPATQWRYLTIAISLLCLSILFFSNLALFIYRLRRSRRRLKQIDDYYRKCFEYFNANP